MASARAQQAMVFARRLLALVKRQERLKAEYQCLGHMIQQLETQIEIIEFELDDEWPLQLSAMLDEAH